MVVDQDKGISRRDLFKGTLGLSAGVAISATILGCQSRGPTPEKPKDMEQEARIKLLESIDSLPLSNIKDLVVQRVVPFFQTPPPTIINRGIELNMVDPTVRLVYGSDPSRVFATYRPRGEAAKVIPVFPITDHVGANAFTFPLIGLSTPEELAALPPQNKGVAFISVGFPSNRRIYEYLSPEIIVTRPDPKIVEERFKSLTDLIEQFCFRKEAVTGLLFDIWLEEAIRVMQEFNLPTHIPVRKENTQTQAEIITQTEVTLNSKGGRYVAAMDIAAHLVTLKALDPLTLSQLAYEQKLGPVINKMDQISLGDTSRDILLNSLRWALASVEGRNLNHIGNIEAEI